MAFSTPDELMAHFGLEQKDIKKHYVAGGCEVYYPYIGDDGKAHLGKYKFKRQTGDTPCETT